MLEQKVFADFNVMQLALISGMNQLIDNFQTIFGLKDLVKLVNNKENEDTYMILRYLTVYNHERLLGMILESPVDMWTPQPVPSSVANISHPSRRNRMTTETLSTLVRTALVYESSASVVLSLVKSRFTDLTKAGLLFPTDYENLISKALKSRDDTALSAITHSLSTRKKTLDLTTAIHGIPMTLKQVTSFSQVSPNYVIPDNMENCMPCAIICYNTHNRPGAEEEMNCLRQASELTNFKTTVIEWKYKADLGSRLISALESICIPNRCCLLFCCVMSHGAQGQLLDVDGAGTEIDYLLQLMNMNLDHKVPVVCSL